MASYTLTIHNVPQENNNIELSYNSNDGRSTESTIIGNSTWTYTLQSLSYSKAIYKPGELIFKLQITGCSGVNAIYSTFKGKKVELTAKADNQENSIAKDYYIFGIQIEKKGNVYYATFQAYDPFKFLTLDKYCKAYTGKKFILDIFWNTNLWPNNLPTAIKDTQFPHEEPIRQKAISEQEKLRLQGIKQTLTAQKTEKENSRVQKESDKTEEEKKANKDENKIKTLDEEIKHLDEEIKKLEEEIKHIEKEIEELDKGINDTTTGDSVFNRTPQFLYYYNGVEFIQPYLVQYNESFFDFMVRVSNRCG